MEKKKFEGYSKIIVNENTPINVILFLINSINQRLCEIEDNIMIDIDGKQKSLTEIIISKMNEQENENE